MPNWWDGLLVLQQISFVIAVAATIIMFIFLLLTIFGIEGTESFDGGGADFDVDIYNDEPFSAIGGLKIVSVRGALAFLSIGGWMVYILAPITHPAVAILVGIISGGLAAYLLALALHAAMKLEQAGNINYEGTVGKVATVYIRIPKARTGKGKIIINYSERLVEVDAVTDDPADILAKQPVEIISLENQTTLVVKIKK